MNPKRKLSWLAICLLLLAAGCDQGNDDVDIRIQPPHVDIADVAEPQPGDRPAAEAMPGSKPLGVLDRHEELTAAQSLISERQFDAAAKRLQNLLFADPTDVQAIFVLALARHAQGDIDQAIDLLGEIPPDHPDAGLAATGQAADWLNERGWFDRAERKYREVLDRVPTASPALRSLAFMLNRQGRRHEAAELIRELCQLGDVRQDELHALISLSSPMIDSDGATAASRPSGDGRRYTPIGPGSRARQYLISADDADALATLEDAITAGNQPPAIVALYGRLLAESQLDQRFESWLQTIGPDVELHSEYWSAVGTYLIGQGRYREATRALLEAVDRDPTDTTSFSRLSQVFETIGQTAIADKWHAKWELSKQIQTANNRLADSAKVSPADIDRLAQLLDQDARPLEATLWRFIAAGARGDATEVMSALNQRRISLVANQRAFPSRTDRLLAAKIDEYPLPVFDRIATVAAATIAEPSALASVTPAAFTNVSDRVGLNHTYQVATLPQRNGFAIYQAYGGAVIVSDYDLSGRCDLFLTQGGCEGPEFVGDQTDRLYRQIDGRLDDVTATADAADYRYTLGGTAGDWNQDGFADVVLANIGQCRLLINNGDGTFSQSPVGQPASPTRVPASVAMADVSGDSLPDIIELAYVDDDSIMVRPPRDETGRVITPVGPKQYRPGVDRVFENDGSGGTRQTSLDGGTDDRADPRTGLGLVVTDFDGIAGNEIFVGNDLCPDQLWSRNADGSWKDHAQILGCAFGTRGTKTASMGIAAADLDNSGTIDLHITNFQTSNSSLFMGVEGVFRERNVQYGLATASRSVLGFGTQAIDYDNDGSRDLVVTNGHIDETEFLAGDFLQPAQLFCNRGPRYDLIDVADPSGYFSSPHLGRGLARLDFDSDGRLDFAVTHLGEQTALLINKTETANRSIRFILVGIASERDAVGASVEIEFADGRLVDWVIAGDGYFCRNERAIHFGLGDAESVDRLTVRWPSGQQQSHTGIAAGKTYLVIEGGDELFQN